MEQAQRANAAQLAARNIKARPRSRRTGSQPPNSTAQQQFTSMQSPSQNGGGGLFGGSIQAPGEFNFSAPAQGLSLPPPSFGPRSNTTKEPSLDESESNGRFAGDDRATKRQFGGPSTIQQSNSPFQTSNPFGQSQPNNQFSATQQPSGGSMFPFGASQPSGPSGINFNSGSTAPATPANPFSFQPASQPAPTTPTSSFGSGPFNFNQQPSQPAGPFGLAPAVQNDKPANSPFLFGQTSGQPSSSSITFGSTPAPTPPTSNFFRSAPTTTTAPPMSNFFGSTTSTAPAPQSNSLFPSTTSAAPTASTLFGTPNPAPPQDKPTSSPFTFGQASAPPSSSGINFGSTPVPAPPTSNLFGSIQPQQSAQPTDSFGLSNQQTASLSNPFAHLNVPASAVSNVTGKQEQKTAAPATGTLFSLSNPAQASTPNNPFGDAAQAPTTPSKPTPFGQQQPQVSPTSNMFGNLNKPTASTADSSNQTQQASAGSVFGNKETKLNNDLFGNLNKPIDQSVAQPKVNGSVPETGPTASSSLFSKPASAANIFGASKSTFTPSPVTNGAKPSSGSAQPPQASGNIFSPMKPLDAPASASQPPPNGMFPSLEHSKSPQRLSGSSLIPGAPAASSTSESVQSEALQRKNTSARQQMKEASEMTEEAMAHLIPPNYTGFQKMGFYQGIRMRILHQAMSDFFASVNPDEDATPVLEFCIQQRGLIMGDTLGLKRKMGEVTDGVDHASKRSKQSIEFASTKPHEQQSKRKLDDEDRENENPTKRTRQIDPSSSAQGLASSEINSNGQASASVNGTNLQSWKAPSSGLPSSSETPLKRQADTQITKDSVARNPLRQVKTPRTNGTMESSSSGSSTSNIFRNILDSPSKSLGNSSPERKMAAIPETSKDDAPRTNAFASLPGVTSSVKFTNGPSSSVFGTKATSVPVSVSSQNLFAPGATSGTPNAFTPKLSAPSNAAAGLISMDQNSNVLKVPKFGNVATNFAEQFRQKAKEAKEKELQKAIDEEYDSDDDLEEFKANWRARELQKMKEMEEIAKNSKGFTFVPSATISSTIKEGSNQASIAATQPSTFPSSLFGQNPSSQASNSISSSVNSSRTPTPGFGSSTGSVLDGHIPGKPVKIGNNIFGHLSDADSGKGGDADDESGDEASEPEGDSEKQDPTYQPDGESASGPGTPAEETGPGLASAKKTNPFTSKFGSASLSGTSTPTGQFTGGLFDRITKVTNPSPSGTSTPMGGFTGGLFDRITKDSNGNVVRRTFDDEEKEKENTQPNTASPFGDMKGVFNKSTAAPSDNTWKPDSPIRFGSSTLSKDGQDPTPTVSVTAATPTKTGSPSSIFSSLNKTPGSTSKPLSNLFGTASGENKPAAPLSTLFGTTSNPSGSTPGTVGFAFGAPSATSSLFPSAAASATTSRATTPGGTTDGDNSGDGDGEAEKEKYVPFNLSTGGPGEEHEDVVHEVRAKALKYSPKEGGDNNAWESKGVGPLRVLKHKETGVSRILLRMDPTGLIILNKSLLSGVKYEAKEKTVKFLTPLDNGAGLETWILQVKTPAFAKTLAEVLEANKPT